MTLGGRGDEKLWETQIEFQLVAEMNIRPAQLKEKKTNPLWHRCYKIWQIGTYYLHLNTGTYSSAGYRNLKNGRITGSLCWSQYPAKIYGWIPGSKCTVRQRITNVHYRKQPNWRFLIRPFRLPVTRITVVIRVKFFLVKIQYFAKLISDNVRSKCPLYGVYPHTEGRNAGTDCNYFRFRRTFLKISLKVTSNENM